MKKIGKILRTLLTGAFSLALLPCIHSQVAKANTEVSIMPYEITIDCMNQKIILTERDSRDHEIICEFGRRTSATSDVCKFYSTNVLDYVSGMTIDLSTLKREQDNYIRLSGNYSEDPITIKIPAVHKAVKATFDPIQAAVKLYDSTDKNDLVQFTSEKIEYRNVYSNWKEYEYYESFDVYDDLTKYQKRGATLYFRLKANDAQQLLNAAPDVTVGDVEDVDGEPIPVYEVGSFPGKEVKVVIPQLPNAPQVKVNYDKQSFTLPRGTEYRVVSGRSDMKWIPAKKSVSMQIDLATLIEKYGQSNLYTFEARYVQTETKPASKIYRLSVTVPDKPVVKSVKANPPVAVGKQNIDQNCLQDSLGSDAFIVQYVYNAKKKVCTGVRIENNLDDSYEICAVSGGGTPSSTDKVTKVINGWSQSKNDATVVTIASSKLREGSKLYIRQKSNSKQKQFCSQWELFGVVSYPEEEPNY